MTLPTIGFIAFCSLSSCISKNGPDLLTTDRAARLLALDTGKVWTRTSMEINGDKVDLADCELQNRFSFGFIEGSDTAFYIGANANCTELSEDTLKRWSWQIVGNIQEEFQDSLMLTGSSGDVEIRRIKELTSNNLSWEFQEEDNEIEESFTWVRESN